MLVVVSYDVNTQEREGRRRLRRVAKACLNYGQRVQNSVFECLIEPAEWTQLRGRLLDEINPKQDSLRFYFLGKNWKNRVEHQGAKEPYDPEGPIVV
ncbi:MAG: CRISPR-associated endonuclease Cas2 [Candidatus Brocadiaceae bacterium]|nr:CRISPR-associated endonuclease Cas2 [Candidatus Brocadiaceae bacterium]